MLEGLFWVAVFGVVYFIVDKVTDVNSKTKEKKSQDPGWTHQKAVEIFALGLFAFLALGALIVFL